MKIGIDVGGVLVEKDDRDTSGGAEDTKMVSGSVTWVEGALETAKKLSEKHELYIISFCGKKRELETINELRNAKVYEYIPESRWFFCRDRKHKPKIMIDNNVEVLVDDRYDIVENCRKSGKRAIHFRGKTGKDCAEDWKRVFKILN
jgi:hypothetical protein